MEHLGLKLVLRFGILTSQHLTHCGNTHISLVIVVNDFHINFFLGCGVCVCVMFAKEVACLIDATWANNCILEAEFIPYSVKI